MLKNYLFDEVYILDMKTLGEQQAFVTHKSYWISWSEVLCQLLGLHSSLKEFLQ